VEEGGRIKVRSHYSNLFLTLRGGKANERKKDKILMGERTKLNEGREEENETCP